MDTTTTETERRGLGQKILWLPIWIVGQFFKLGFGLIRIIFRLAFRLIQTLIGAVMEHLQQGIREFVGRLLG